jgi:hypothetical protein
MYSLNSFPNMKNKYICSKYLGRLDYEIEIVKRFEHIGK